MALKEVIRARFPQEQDAVPRPDPEGNEVRANLIITIIQGLLQYTQMYKLLLYGTFIYI